MKMVDAECFQVMEQGIPSAAFAQAQSSLRVLWVSRRVYAKLSRRTSRAETSYTQGIDRWAHTLTLNLQDKRQISLCSHLPNADQAPSCSLHDGSRPSLPEHALEASRVILDDVVPNVWLPYIHIHNICRRCVEHGWQDHIVGERTDNTQRERKAQEDGESQLGKNRLWSSAKTCSYAASPRRWSHMRHTRRERGIALLCYGPNTARTKHQKHCR